MSLEQKINLPSENEKLYELSFPQSSLSAASSSSRKSFRFLAPPAVPALRTAADRDSGCSLFSFALMVLVLFIVCAAADSRLLAQAPTARTEKRAVTHSLTLIKPDQAEFDALLKRNFPGLSGVQDFGRMRPLLTLVRNDTQTPAIAYTVRWTAAYQSGDVQTLDGSFMLRRLGRGPNVTLLPGAIRLVAPMFSLTPRQYQAIPNFAQRYSASQFPEPTGLVSSAVELEGVVYSNDHYAGPEGRDLWRRCAATWYAAHDEALSVLDLVNSSTQLEPLLASLNAHAQRGNAEVRTDFIGTYVRARGETAADLRALLLRNGSANFLQTLTKLANSSRPQGKFSPAATQY